MNEGTCISAPLLAIALETKGKAALAECFQKRQYIIALIWSNWSASKKPIQYKNVRFKHLEFLTCIHPLKVDLSPQNTTKWGGL